MTRPPLPRLLVTSVGPLIAFLFIAYSLHRSEVAARDIIVFTIYVALGLVLPGFVLWRALVARGRGSMLTDLVCGASLAFAVELCVYLICAHLNHPGLAFLWPVLPMAASLHPRARSKVWRRPAEQVSRGLNWTLSAVVVYATATVTRAVWNPFPLKGEPLHTPYVDTPYHLSLIGALSRHVPVDVPSVAGEPLYYHWFFHADMAAARHATGIEPMVLLTRLGPLAMTVVIILGTAVIAQWLTRSELAAAGAAVLLCGTSALPHDFGPGAAMLTGYTFLSPTTAFAMALLVTPVVVIVDALDPDTEMGWGAWAVIVVSLGAVSGAKGSLLPVLLGGLVAVLAMALLLRRQLHRRALGLTAIGVGWFLLAQHYVYGGSSQGTEVGLFGFGSTLAANLDVAPRGDVAFGVAAGTTLVYLLALLPMWSGMPGLFTRGVWRDPRAHFVVACVLAALGAVIVFDNSAFNEVYFFRAALPLLAIAGVWGLVVLARRLPVLVARRTAVAGAALGLVLGSLGRIFFGPDYAVTSAVRLLLPPTVLVVACAAAGMCAGAWLASRDGAAPRRMAALLAAGIALAALALPGAMANAATMISHPHDQFRKSTAVEQVMIGPGGVTAARWLRDHSDTDDIVATNDHCLFPGAAICDRRPTWVAAFTERQVLVEGWAYTSRTAADAEKQHVWSAMVTRFWAPSVLRANDLAFRRPTAARIARLHDRYGVDWMFVDRRFRADVRGLRKVAAERFRTGSYVVFRIR